jgi:hypothetical protein
MEIEAISLLLHMPFGFITRRSEVQISLTCKCKIMESVVALCSLACALFVPPKKFNIKKLARSCDNLRLINQKSH